jgi:L-fucose isomerase-like protein
MKIVVQPVHLVGRHAHHVFALDNQQLEVAIGAGASAPKVHAIMARVQAQLESLATFREPVVMLDDTDRARVAAAAADADAILLSLTTAKMDGDLSEAADGMGMEAGIWDLDIPILAYSGENTPMMALYILPPSVRRQRPNVHYCLDARDLATQLTDIRLAKVRDRLAHSKMIILGQYNCADRLPDPESVKNRLGIEMKQVPAADFMTSVATVDEASARRIARQWAEGSLPGAESSEQEIYEVARVHIALETLMRNEAAQAVSVGCLEIMYGHQHVPFCWVLASLRDAGLPAGCEHDAGATLTMLMLEYLADRPAYMGNLVEANPDQNTVSISHGCSPTRMWGRDQPAKPYRLVHSHSAPPFSRDLTGGSGVTSYVDYGDVGQPVTIARLGADVGSMFVARGEIIACRDTICDRTTLTVRVIDARHYAHQTTGNHQVLIYGDFSQELTALSRSLGLEILAA